MEWDEFVEREVFENFRYLNLEEDPFPRLIEKETEFEMMLILLFYSVN